MSGFTHLAATVVAMSRNIASSCDCLSLSDTCNSPLANICGCVSIRDHPLFQHYHKSTESTLRGRVYGFKMLVLATVPVHETSLAFGKEGGVAM